MSYRVLVVDDDENVREALCLMLEPEGFTVQSAANGRQALEQLRSGSYNCLVVDLRMPGMNGLILYQAVKQLAPGLARRIVFSTGELLDDSLRWFLEGTGNRVLLKPFRMSQLIEACRLVCEG
jgi:CheY-like chemotaxis protein